MAKTVDMNFKLFSFPPFIMRTMYAACLVAMTIIVFGSIYVREVSVLCR